MKNHFLYFCAYPFIFLLVTSTGYAFDYHISYMGNYNITDGELKGQDYTLILARNFGLRYSQIASFDFVEKDSLTEKNGVARYGVKGNYKMPMLLKMIDYKNFDAGHKGPFDFLTAYYGVGYTELDMKIRKTSYTASGNQMIRSKSSENVKVPIYAASVGFYGGEKFAVIDTRIRYIRGEIKDSDIIDKKIKFNDWAIIFSFGVGF